MLTTAKEAFEAADLRFVEAVQRVMSLSTTKSIHDRRLDWTEFREEMRQLYMAAEERHATKHMAILEAERCVPFIVAVKEE